MQTHVAGFFQTRPHKNNWQLLRNIFLKSVRSFYKPILYHCRAKVSLLVSHCSRSWTKSNQFLKIESNSSCHRLRGLLRLVFELEGFQSMVVLALSLDTRLTWPAQSHFNWAACRATLTICVCGYSSVVFRTRNLNFTPSILRFIVHPHLNFWVSIKEQVSALLVSTGSMDISISVHLSDM